MGLGVTCINFFATFISYILQLMYTLVYMKQTMNRENADVYLGLQGTLLYKKQYYLDIVQVWKVTFEILHGSFAPFLSIGTKNQ